MKSKIFVSFSGGQTSAYMALWIRDNYPGSEIKYVFANTGQEHEETYRFINNIEYYYGLPVTWIEAVIPRSGEKSYKIVNYETACRDGSLFDDMCNRFGIPNMGYIHCTRELKTEPMYKYIHSEWKKGTYKTAIGIRADESDRVSEKYQELNYWYPLAFSEVKKHGVIKNDVNQFWDNQPFKLGIPNYMGNCVWCWKKSFSKHMRIMESDISYYDVPKKLEDKYGECHIKDQVRYGQKQPFFRRNMWTTDLIREFKENHLAQQTLFDMTENYENSCKESCEPIGVQYEK